MRDSRPHDDVDVAEGSRRQEGMWELSGSLYVYNLTIRQRPYSIIIISYPITQLSWHTCSKEL